MSDSEQPRPSRRQFVIGSASVVAIGTAVTAPAVVSAARTRLVAATPPRPRTLAEVFDEVDNTVGLRLRNSPWLSWFGGSVQGWSAVYVTWLLRTNGVARTASVPNLWRAFSAAGRTGTTPRPGAVIFYTENGHFVRAGIVTGVTRGLPQTVEGDDAPTVATSERFVRRLAAPSSRSVRFAYPDYR